VFPVRVGTPKADPSIELSSRPERTRISRHAALDAAACAPFLKERRMMFANVTNFYRKSGVAQWRDLRFRLCDPCRCEKHQVL
jgi:hypothetical protein